MAARRRRSISSVRGLEHDMYLLTRTVGDIAAAGRGRGALGRRVMRRRMRRGFFRSISSR